MIFNYYPADITKSKPLGDIYFDRMLLAIKNPKEKTKDIFEKIKAAEESGNMALKNKLKTHLYYFTPCVYVKNSRKYENISHWTGLLALDFDHLEEKYAIEFKKELFKEYKFIIAAWLSPSKHGVRAIVKIPTCYSVDEFKSYFNAIKNELSIYRGWDSAPQNCILPMFLSYDPDLLERKNYSMWNKKYIAPEPPVVKQYISTDKTNTVEKIIDTMISQIIDNGHPQLRRAAYVLGGYVGGGYINNGYALQMIEKMIDCNAYLSQKAKTYKKTANTMINNGIKKPLYLRLR